MNLFKISLLTLCTVSLSSCVKIESDKNNSKKNILPSKKISAELKETFNLKKMPYRTFVLSCGSGCAMTYVAHKAIKNQNKIDVLFTVDFYEDEILTENYEDVFTFIYNDKNELIIIKRDKEEEDFLKSQNTNSQLSFTKFSKDLILEIAN